MRRQLCGAALVLCASLPLNAEEPVNDQAGLRFEQLFPVLQSLPNLPPLEPFQARDGAVLGYRRYVSAAPVDLILLHGSAAESTYLTQLAQRLRDAGAATVYTPDVRGHGPAPQRRGDIDHVKQLEDDLADFIAHLKAASAGPRKIVVAGHSSGGGLVLRFAGGRHGYLANGYLLLAPYLGHDAPTVRKNSGGWVEPSLAKIVAIAILNGFGVTRFNDTPVLRFNLPERYRTGRETLSYSWRLMTGFNPTNYRRELAAIRVPLLVLVGADDEAFLADRFEPTIRPLVAGATVEVVPGVSHLGLVASEAVAAHTAAWLKQALR